MSFLLDFCYLGALLGSVGVISSRNPVNSVFYLIVVFALATVILFSLGIEYLAILMWIVYVGAIAILFIFVLKLLNIKIVELQDNASRYIPVGLFVGILLYLALANTGGSAVDTGAEAYGWAFIAPPTNIVGIGELLFDHYAACFIVAGIILLLAMVGAIVLTLGHEDNVRRQDIFSQIHAPTL